MAKEGGRRKEGGRAKQAGDDGAIDYLQNNKLLEVRARGRTRARGPTEEEAPLNSSSSNFSGDIPSSAKSSRASEGSRE